MKLIHRTTKGSVRQKAKKTTSDHQVLIDSSQEAVQSYDQNEGQLALDIYQIPTHIVIVAPIAGVKPNDIETTVTEDVLTIKGKRSFEFDISPENYFTQECFWGNFSRSIILPAAVDTTKIEATFKDGVLKIYIPRTDKHKTKIVRIKSH